MRQRIERFDVGGFAVVHDVLDRIVVQSRLLIRLANDVDRLLGHHERGNRARRGGKIFFELFERGVEIVEASGIFRDLRDDAGEARAVDLSDERGVFVVFSRFVKERLLLFQNGGIFNDRVGNEAEFYFNETGFEFVFRIFGNFLFDVRKEPVDVVLQTERLNLETDRLRFEFRTRFGFFDDLIGEFGQRFYSVRILSRGGQEGLAFNGDAKRVKFRFFFFEEARD